MISPPALPPVVKKKLTGIAYRIRLSHLLHTSSVLVFVVVAFFLASFCADVAFGFSHVALKVASLTFALVVMGLAIVVAGSFLRRPSPYAVAAFVEHTYPEMEERLLSTVGLSASERNDSSAVLVGALADETALRVETVDAARVVPLNREVRLLRWVCVGVLVTMLACVVVPPVRDFSSRFFSAWFVPASTPMQVTCALEVAPIQLTGFTVTISPPEYVNPKLHAVRVLKDPDEETMVCSEFSRVRYEVRFDRPAVGVHFLLDDGRIAQSDFQMSEDRLSGFVELPYLPPGEHYTTLHFFGDKETERWTCKIRSAVSLRVVPDAPPVFSNVKAPETVVVAQPVPPSADVRKARPDETLSAEFAVEDVGGLKSVEVEYRINDKFAGTHVVAKLEGETKAAREFVFPLAGRVKDGDWFFYRLKATDNRKVRQASYVDEANQPYPPKDLDPQTSFAPAGWFALRISTGAEPLENPDALAARVDRLKLAELARQQEDLAKQAAELDPAMQEERKRLEEEQARLSEELRRLVEQSKSLQKALEAMRSQEAQRLSKEAHQLARKQRELADQAGDNLREQLLKKLAPLAEKQEKLAQEAGKLGKETDERLDASGMDRFANDQAKQAAKALRDAQGAKALAHQSKSLDELQRLARNLEDRSSPSEAARQLAKRQEALYQKLEKLAQDFARLQPEMVRQGLDDLAKTQKALQEAIKKLPVPSKKDEAVQQRRKVDELAGQIADQIRGDPASAFEKMGPLRQALEQLAEQMPKEDPKASKDDPKAKTQIEAARQLAKEQEELRAAVQQALKEAMGEGAAKDNAARQNQIMEEAKKLADELMELAQKGGLPEGGKEKAGEAAQSAEQAQQSMQKSQEQNQGGSPEQGKEAGQEAARQLDQAGINAAMAASKAEASKTAEQLQQGQQAMRDAQGELKQGKGPAASKAMQRAAQAMQNVAGRIDAPASTQGVNTYTGSANIGDPGARPDGASKDMELPKSRAWGELPGELRTRILQDIRARHGEEYGAIIQHYFEQIADTPAKKK